MCGFEILFTVCDVENEKCECILNRITHSCSFTCMYNIYAKNFISDTQTLLFSVIRQLSWAGDFLDAIEFQGPLTIRRTPLPSFLINFSTFAFLLNFSFMK